MLDEHFSPAIAEQLQTRGHDVLAVAEHQAIRDSPLRGISDARLLEWASVNKRVLVSENAQHFMPLHRAYLAAGKSHDGIRLTSNRKLPRHSGAYGLLVHALATFLEGNQDRSMENDVVWL